MNWPQEHVPASRPNSPGAEERIESLRQAAVKAWTNAGGEPTGGKWAHLVWVLRLGCTRGKIVVDEDKSHQLVCESGLDWMLPETEEEWFKLEAAQKEHLRKTSNAAEAPCSDDKGVMANKNYNSSSAFLEKVIGWQTRVEDIKKLNLSAASAVPSAAITGTGKVKLKDPLPLGFVAKRTSTKVLAEMQGKASKYSDEESSNRPVTSTPNHPKQMIADIGEMSFFPPSFPSNLETSTPNKPGREKPVPIPFISSQSPMSLSPNTPVTGEQLISPPVSVRPEKRRRSVSPSVHHSGCELDETSHQQNLKKLRTKSNIPSSSSLSSKKLQQQDTGSNAPTTLPSDEWTANDLRDDIEPSTPTKHLPTLTELLVSSSKSKKHNKPTYHQAALPRMSPTAELAPDLEKPPSRPKTPVDSSPVKSFFATPETNSSIGSHLPLRSPVSPLFSENRSAFVPNITSTQRPRDDNEPPVDSGLQRESSGFFTMGYDSQIDVEGQIDRVSELLERDIDFDGWLKDPSLPPGEHDHSGHSSQD